MSEHTPAYYLGLSSNGSAHAVRSSATGRRGGTSAACRSSVAVIVETDRKSRPLPAYNPVDVTCKRCARILGSSAAVPAESDTRPLALAYVRVSTEEQATEGVSLDAQRARLMEAGERRGYRVEVVADEGVSAKNLRRPGLRSALARLDSGEAEALLAVRIDRVSRSVHDFAGLIRRAERKGWRLVMLDPDVDLATASGRFAANVLVSAAEYERDLIGARTREAMARRKAQGVHLGRTTTLSPETVQRIIDERAAGASLRAIADRLNADGVVTGQGGARWYAGTVRAVLGGSTALALTASR